MFRPRCSVHAVPPSLHRALALYRRMGQAIETRTRDVLALRRRSTVRVFADAPEPVTGMTRFLLSSVLKPAQKEQQGGFKNAPSGR